MSRTVAPCAPKKRVSALITLITLITLIPLIFTLIVIITIACSCIIVIITHSVSTTRYTGIAIGMRIGLRLRDRGVRRRIKPISELNGCVWFLGRNLQSWGRHGELVHSPP